jgi:hypothetical protein
MADPVSLASLFDAAEQAAMGGDFAAASRLLGDAARAQEAALGPDHLDLANTLNNLAVAHERCGQLDEAEREYRRAHAIAARALPADDPLVTTSAQNLREFCAANGRSIDAPAAPAAPADMIGDAVTVRMAAPTFAAPVDPPTTPVEPLALTFGSDAEAKAPTRVPAPPGGGVRTPASSTPAESAEPLAIRAAQAQAPTPPAAATARPTRPPAPDRPTATVMPKAPPASAPAVAAAGRRLSIPVLVALGAIAVLVIWLLSGRGPAAPPAAPQAAAPEAPSAAPPAAAPSPAPSAPAAPSATRPAQAPVSAPAAAAADGSVSVGDAQLCTSLSAGYRCTAAGDTVRPGPLVFYTRLVATRDTSVVHRWYRGNDLRQAIRLDVPARRQGFRTFSRGTVSATDGEWRVELRTRDGQLLHTARFTVR